MGTRSPYTMKAEYRISMLLVFIIYLHKAGGAKLDIANIEDGDVIDCVDIHKQPSLDHPLLKNHTIQMRPTSYPFGLLTHEAFAMASMTRSKNEECPDTTIPIRRAYKNESISWRKSLHFTQFNGSSSSKPKGNSHMFAAAFQKTAGQERFGVAATISMWKPRTERADYTIAQLWLGYVLGLQVVETIEAGWQVYPQHYHSNSPRLFVLYTNNGYKSYCYNLDCPGFIHVDKSVTLGAELKNVSSYKGRQHIIDIALVQDLKTKNLWFYFGGKGVGYWPPTLFKYLANGGNIIAWGGEVFEAASSRHPTWTAMGSGHFPEEGFHRASYFGKMRYLERDRMTFPNANSTSYVNTHWSSYHALPLSTDQRAIATFGQHFYFGGPGGGH